MFKPVFRSIVSGKKVDSESFDSRWLLFGELHLSDSTSDEDVFLVPASGQSSISPFFAERGCSGSFPKSTLPAETDLDSLLSLGDHLEKYVNNKANADTWFRTPPLEPNISNSANLLPLEELIAKDLAALEAAFSRPRSDIEATDECVPLSRVRRPSHRAPAYLSAHTEDWENVGLKGVVPRRILSRIRVENLTIYENCMMARLADNLAIYVAKRINKLKKILRAYEESCDMGQDLVGTHFRQRRVAHIWGEMFQGNIGGSLIESNLNELEKIYFRLLGLKNRPLYRAIPHDTKVPRDLKNTNILTNDPLYRKGAELWLEWRRKDQESDLSLQQQYERQQKACRAMNHFAFLLCLRALKILDPKVASQLANIAIVPPLKKTIICLGHSFSIEWHRDGSIALRSGDESCSSELRVASLPANLAGVSSKDDAKLIIDQWSADENKWNLVLYLEDDSHMVAGSTWFNSAGNEEDAEVKLPQNFMVFGVSPLNIGSTEKVARAIRWFFANHVLKTYPHRFEITHNPDSLKEYTNHEWLKHEGSDYCICDTPNELIVSEISAKLEAQKNELKDLEKKLTEIPKSGRNHGGQGRGVDKAAEKDIKLQIDTAKSSCSDWETAQTAIQTGIEIIKLIKSCPVCHSEAADTIFSARDNGCYHCKCNSCKTTWGLEPRDNSRVPILIPGGKVIEQKGFNVDRIYGADFLAPYKK